MFLLLPKRALLLFSRRRCRPNALLPANMPLFFAMFKTLEGKTVLVELKNSLQIRGRLVSVDQYLNMKLEDIEITDRANFPQLVRPPARMHRAQCLCRLSLRALHPRPCPIPLRCLPGLATRALHSPPHHALLLPHHTPPPTAQLSVRSLFVRGGVVRYVQLPPEAVDTDLLQDASRKEALEAAKGKR